MSNAIKMVSQSRPVPRLRLSRTAQHLKLKLGSAMGFEFNWRDHLKVHPAADLFPLMSEAELKELAEDPQERIAAGDRDLAG
jgi:hypothetical protein